MCVCAVGSTRLSISPGARRRADKPRSEERGSGEAGGIQGE